MVTYWLSRTLVGRVLTVIAARDLIRVSGPGWPAQRSGSVAATIR